MVLANLHNHSQRKSTSWPSIVSGQYQEKVFKKKNQHNTDEKDVWRERNMSENKNGHFFDLWKQPRNASAFVESKNLFIIII